MIVSDMSKDSCYRNVYAYAKDTTSQTKPRVVVALPRLGGPIVSSNQVTDLFPVCTVSSLLVGRRAYIIQ